MSAKPRSTSLLGRLCTRTGSPVPCRLLALARPPRVRWDMYVAGTQKMPVVLYRIRLAAVARGCRMVTSESDKVLAKHMIRGGISLSPESLKSRNMAPTRNDDIGVVDRSPVVDDRCGQEPEAEPLVIKDGDRRRRRRRLRHVPVNR